MNSAIEQTKAIEALLTYPQQAAKILAVRSNLINYELVKKIEQLSYQMKTNGSPEAAAFLASLIPRLNRLIDTADINSWDKQIETSISPKTTGESAKIHQQATNAYRYLIDALLTYPNQTTKLLASHQNLLDRNLVEMMKKLAALMAANGSREAAAFLHNIILRLAELVSASPLEDEVLSIEHPGLEIVGSQQSRAITIKSSVKNRFASFSGIAMLAFFFLVAINNQLAQNRFISLPQVLATDSNELTETLASNIAPVETIEIEPVKSYQSTRNYSGQIVAKQNSELSFPLAGKLAALTVQEGDFVEKGTPIAYLNTDNLQNQQQELLARKAQAVAQLKELQAGERPETIAAAKAVVSNFEGQLELENKRRSRRASLYAEGAISREQLDEAKGAAASLQARLNEAQSELDRLEAGTRPERIEAQQASIRQLDANIANIQLELDKSVLKAPFAGTISQRQVDEGAVVSAGQAVFRLVEDRVLEAHIGIPLDRSEQVKVGETLALNIGKDVHQAKVVSLLPELDADTRTLTAVLSLEQKSDRRIFPGQIARLQLTQTVAKSGFWLPIESLVRGEQGLWYSYVVVETASEKAASKTKKPIFKIERRAVEVLHSDNKQVLISGTLQPGEKVVANDIERLVLGQLVTLK